MSEYIYTALLAMSPLLELRLSIPVGHLTFGLSLPEVILISFVSSLFSAAVVLALLPHIIAFLERHIPVFHRVMVKILKKTRHEHSKKMALVGETFLIGFVAIPIPGSGAWTGVLICYLFGIPYKKSLFIIGLGILLSAVLISLLTIFGNEVWQMLFDDPEKIIHEFEEVLIP